MPPGDMTPLHVHKKQSQTTYLLEGDVKLWLPDRARICGPGGCLYQQIGVPHAEHVTSTGPARVLDINAPAGFDEFGFDRFVAAVGQPAKGMTLPEPVVEPDPEQLANLRYKIWDRRPRSSRGRAQLAGR
jgi:hypothetical protein